MDWFLVAIAFLLGIIIRPAVVALVKGEAINFSMNTKYFAFSFRIGESKIVLASLDAKMSKRKPTLDLEPNKETITNEEFVEEPKKEKTSDEEPRDETNPSEKPKDDPGDSPENEKSPGNRAIKTVIGATVGAGVALVGIPACIGALGLTGAGIAAGSIAAKMMSTAAIANGGKAVLQSVGEWGGQGSWASSPWQGTQGCILDLL
ncbi:uncharacterized protein LOC117007697 [Catharus ustulatus]|uniref:uncharacterized protein LOC117007697 n=1 Tax=Catharus ustulatus TaxID=91951 RepID=UPI00140763E6|nr:uncharacterized protein LOC117007697 [Catharus ustulatus]